MASDPVLIDRFGRVATDLRISLTDRCSLRCSYCMPAEGLDWLPREELLTDDEIVTLAETFISCGITSVRLTGGEPLLHRTLADIVTRLAAASPRPELSLTTNGVGLLDKAEALVAAGLDRINVSVDTLRPERFLALTRRNRLDDVLAGVAAAASVGLAPVKINAVLMRDSNFDEAPALLAWALRQGYRLRFIEHMPLDAQQSWSREQMVSAEEILELLGRDYSLLPIGHGPDGSAPAEEFQLLDGPGRADWDVRAGAPPTVGIIASVTRPFCRDCDRLRLTADGQLRTCLFAREETDLRTPLRAGASRDELIAIISDAVAGKQSGHGIGSELFLQPQRPMSAIGG
ncbi:cyclic pyranopterin monophosphate synthase subunit MoaA [Frankineae bacterium MT45]|nr:cyclic pyranopterin monophosphate synthase subunit MoaA [Frankineae bacterium MT45]